MLPATVWAHLLKRSIVYLLSWQEIKSLNFPLMFAPLQIYVDGTDIVIYAWLRRRWKFQQLQLCIPVLEMAQSTVLRRDDCRNGTTQMWNTRTMIMFDLWLESPQAQGVDCTTVVRSESHDGVSLRVSTVYPSARYKHALSIYEIRLSSPTRSISVSVWTLFALNSTKFCGRTSLSQSWALV